VAQQVLEIGDSFLVHRLVMAGGVVGRVLAEVTVRAGVGDGRHDSRAPDLT
jgi:hypothetical protein